MWGQAISDFPQKKRQKIEEKKEEEEEDDPLIFLSDSEEEKEEEEEEEEEEEGWWKSKQKKESTEREVINYVGASPRNTFQDAFNARKLTNAFPLVKRGTRINEVRTYEFPTRFELGSHDLIWVSPIYSTVS